MPGRELQVVHMRPHVQEILRRHEQEAIDDYEDIPAEHVIFISVMPDDSWSISEHGNTEKIIDAHNRIIRILNKAAEAPNILYRTEYLNGHVLNNWVRLEDARHMDKYNYEPIHGTPLYDGTVSLLSKAEARVNAATENSNRARFGALILSDGEDFNSKKFTAEDVRQVMTQIFERNDPTFPNTIAFLGVPNKRVDYRSIANSMGITDERINKRGKFVKQILTPKDTSQELRRAVDTWSMDQVVYEGGQNSRPRHY